MKRLLNFLLFLISFSFFFSACAKEDREKNIGEIFIGKPAPDFRLKDLQRKDVSLADMKGKAVLLRFWSTRCPSCKEEMPRLESIYKDMMSKGFEIIAVNIEDTKEKALGFAKEFNLTYPILMDEEQKVSGIYKVFGVPTSFFVDREGIIRERLFGDIDRKTFDDIVLPLLEGRVSESRAKEKKSDNREHSGHKH